MADELKDQRIPIMMSPSEVKAIDDWMFSNRIKSRGEAIRTLVRFGLRKAAYESIIEASRMMVRALQGKEDFEEARSNYVNSVNQHIDMLKNEIEATWNNAEINIADYFADIGNELDQLSSEQKKDLAKKIVNVAREFHEKNKS